MTEATLPTPYWESDDGLTVYHADALQALDELRRQGRRFRAVIMDPPYASGARTEAAKASSGAMMRGQRWASKPIENDQMTSTGFIWLMRETVLLVREMLDEGASPFSFIDWRQWPNLVGALESCNLRVNQMVVWDKTSYGLGNGFRSQHELIAHASKGTPRVCDHGLGNVLPHEALGDVLQCKREEAEHHPSPKPPRLIADLIRVCTEPGDEVLDPYMGGGATLVAARMLGRKATGIEAIEEHCRTTVARLGAVVPREIAKGQGMLIAL